MANEFGSQAEQKLSALLICRDSAARKWGPRWLKDCGFEAIFPVKLTHALETAKTLTPTIIIVDAGLRDQNKAPLFETLLYAADIDASLIVLCSNAREVDAAMDAGVTDIVRKPFDWRLIARRADNPRLRTKLRESLPLPATHSVRHLRLQIVRAFNLEAGSRLSRLPDYRTRQHSLTC